MTAHKWNGVGDYDVLLTLSKDEMRALMNYYSIDWSSYMTGPAKSFDGNYYCFASFSRMKLALLPFLSLVFGGMYDELPIGPEQSQTILDFGDYSLEEFAV